MFTATQSGILNNITRLVSTEINKIYQVIAVFSCLVIVGCGGGGGNSDTATATVVETIKLVGSVGDGPIVGSSITVKDVDGKLIASTTSDNSAAYEISVPGNTKFPVTIIASGGTDIVSGMAPDFTLVTVALKKADLNSKKRTVNINPFSTFIVYMAQSMNGGLTADNVSSAKQALFDTFSFGLDASAIPDPISSDIDNINIAGMIKASESMGEMIRRTRDAMISSGTNIDGDYVLTKLANDLADGKLDAIGNNTVSAISATAKIVSAQVLIETIRNQLKVNGTNATSLLDSAILTSQPTSSMSTADVSLTDKVLAQTQTALAAVERFAPSTEVSSLVSIVSGLSNNVTAADVNTTLAINSEDILNTAINLAPLATDQELASINNDNTTITPIAPVINSSPVLTADESIAYSYDVNASDANAGDSLTYSLTTAPAGMTINATTGLISWTPGSSQVGTQNVTVLVTDDSSSALSASQGFSIAVTAVNVIPANTAPVISSNAILTAKEGIAYSYDVNATDANTGDALTYSLNAAPSGMMINASTGLISWTPSSSQVGTQNVTVTVSDNGTPALSANQGFSIAVTAANVAPVITSNAGLTAQEGVAYSYDVNATDVNNGDSLSYALTSAPAGMSINASSGLINWTPVSSQVGPQNITVRVTDNGSPALFASQGFTITVSDLGSLNISNTAPSSYIWDTLDNNNLMFSDRSYLLGVDAGSQIHDSYRGMNYLSTGKDDRATIGNSLVSFTVNAPVTVFVAHDNAITNKPAWLSTWSDTGDDMINRSIYQKDFDAGTIILGGNTADGIVNGSMYLVFINPRVQVSGTKILIDGSNGTASTVKNTLAYIDVTTTAGDTVTLSSQPSNGSAVVVDGNIIQYTPDTEFSGTDSITYEITDTNGNISLVTMTITVTCTSCIKSAIFDLYWDAVNGSEAGYQIYYGATASTATTLGYDIITGNLPNPTAPSAVVRSDDLGLQIGETACFRIKAYDNTNNTSDYSSAVCTTI